MQIVRARAFEHTRAHTYADCVHICAPSGYYLRKNIITFTYCIYLCIYTHPRHQNTRGENEFIAKPDKIYCFYSTSYSH